MDPVTHPRFFGGDGIYFGHNEDQGPIWLRYGIWYPLMNVSGDPTEKYKALKAFFKKYHPEDYDELTKHIHCWD